MDIIKIGDLIINQDNRGTESPMFVIEESVMIQTTHDYGYDSEVWECICDGEKIIATDTTSRRLDLLDYHGRSTRGWQKVYLKETWKFITSCFTLKGCEEYIEANKHNIGKYRIYTYGSYRNVEFQSIRNHLVGLTKAQLAEYFVFSSADIVKYLDSYDRRLLESLCKRINEGRQRSGSPPPIAVPL